MSQTREDIADYIFGEGKLTDEQRMENRVFVSRHGYRFSSRRDLMGVISVKVPEHIDNTSNKMAEATAEFIGEFCTWTFKRLNGFSGFDTLRFIIE